MKSQLKITITNILLGVLLSSIPLDAVAQTVIEKQEPATYQEVEVKKVVEPAKVKTTEIPAEYIEVETKQLVKPGGMTEWREVPGLKPESVQPAAPKAQVSLLRIQEKLKEKGYYDGAVDNILGPKTKKAAVDFMRANGFSFSHMQDSIFLGLLGLQ